MNDLLSTMSNKRKNSAITHHAKPEHTFLDMAQMYCCIGNYNQAFEWCMSYLEWGPPNVQLKHILHTIILKSHSVGLRQQVATLSQELRKTC